jgi:hypothetical protein
VADPVDDVRGPNEVPVADCAGRIVPRALDRVGVEYGLVELTFATEIPEHPRDVGQRRERRAEPAHHRRSERSELGRERFGLDPVSGGKRDGGANGIRSRLRLQIGGARRLGGALGVTGCPVGVAPRESKPAPQRNDDGICGVTVARVDRCDRVVRERDSLVRAAVEVRPERGLRACRPQKATETVPGEISETTVRAPRLHQFGEEMELRREVRVRAGELVEHTRLHGDRDRHLDLVEPPAVAEAAARTADHVLEARAFTLHAELLDQRQRLRTDANRLLEPAGEQQRRAPGQVHLHQRCLPLALEAAARPEGNDPDRHSPTRNDRPPGRARLRPGDVPRRTALHPLPRQEARRRQGRRLQGRGHLARSLANARCGRAGA